MKKIKACILVILFILPIMLVGCKNSNKSTMASPSELSVSTGGIITFARVDDDEYYAISINDVEFKVFAETSSPYVELFNTDGKNYLSYDASRYFTLGESYNVKVKACATDKVDSAYSATVTYSHTIPIEKVSNIQILGTVLTWDTVEYSSYYIVKVITPYDSLIYDYSGELLTSDDAETIADADLTAYQFSANRFDFSSILTAAGEYKFYINAVSSSTLYSDSGYSYKTTYQHVVDLTAPTSVAVHKVTEYNDTSEQYEDNLHLISVVDINTTAIEVVCNSMSITVELNNSSSYVTSTNNLIDINLTKIFSSVLDLSSTGSYTFTLRSVDLTQEADQKFYNNSDYCEAVNYNIYSQLEPANIQITYNDLNENYILTWSSENDETNVAGYAVYVLKAGEVLKYEFSESSSLVLPENFISASVQVLAKGNYISSALSEFLSVLTSSIINSISISYSDPYLYFTAVSNAYYVVEIENEILIQGTNYIDLSAYIDTVSTLSVTYILDGYIPLTKVFNLDYSIRLDTPSIGSNQGFVSENSYLLTFTGVEDAIGYYIYLLGDNMTESVQIPRLYTTTSINLSSYIINQGEYTTYQVQIQAVADPYSSRIDSYLTDLGLLSITHTRVLGIPEFLKDGSGIVAPVEKVTSSSETKYYLNFYGVAYADSYEIMINFNRLTVSNLGDGLYRVEITKYMTIANSYTIMVRALPSSSDSYIKASEYNIYEYVLTMQLDEVTNIRVAENDGVYTLSFDMQENAVSYRVRIVKLNDGSYAEYLANLGLSNPFEVIQTVDITDYVKEAGEYYIYVTALADKSGGYYGDSDESSTYAVVNKLTSLSTPTDVLYYDESSTSFLISWTGDSSADYYIVKVTDPNDKTKEYKSRTTTLNINDSITVEGSYIVTVKAMVNSTGTSATVYTSSPTSDEYTILYLYTEEFDYERYSVYIYGENQNFVISDINDLKNILWYHYLFGVDENYYLNLYVEPNEGSVYDAILAIAADATKNVLYNFSSDSVWLSMLNNSSEGTLFAYLSARIIELYPELAVLDEVTIMQHTTGSAVFKIKYSNTLDVEKEETSSSFISLATDYGNDYDYLDSFSRRSDNAVFNIDSCTSMDVETTEQLLLAVQYGKKPNFVGDCDAAETVYNNARKVLLAIVNNNMSDLEKVTHIFDWISYALNLNYLAGYTYVNNVLTMGELSDYGTRAEYYLEGLFYNLFNEDHGGYDGEFYLGDKHATSELYAKAFTLLCAIEGIETRKVTGEVTVATSITDSATISHTWNKVYLDTSDSGKAWYAVDLTYSDNMAVYYSVSQSYSMSSHLYFLVSDSFLYNHNSNVENEIIESKTCSTSYDYYSNATFAMDASDITSTINYANAGEFDSFEYTQFYSYVNDSYYQLYSSTSGFGQIQAFILNSMIYAAYKLNTNSSGLSCFEFRISATDMGSSTLTGANQISTILESFNTYYAKKTYSCSVKSMYDSETSTTIYIYTFS